MTDVSIAFLAAVMGLRGGGGAATQETTGEKG